MVMQLTLEPLRDAQGKAALPGEDLVQASASLTGAGGDAGLRLWWSFPRTWASALNGWADPWLIGLLFPMMAQAARLGKSPDGTRPQVRVEGRVSPSLLENLENYMRIWQSWVPGAYLPVEILPAEEIEAPTPASSEVITAYSGGVDSCYTVWENVHGRGRRLNRKIGLAVIMHGFDIWLDQPNADAMYTALRAGARKQLDSVGIESIPMVSNFHELPGTWGHTFGTQLVSGLQLLGGRFHGALISNNLKFNQPNKPWGSTPLIDRYLSSHAFPVMDYGGEAGRFDKLAAIAHWPEALAHLRVCFSNPGDAANCCICEKCVRTMIACRIVGVAQPASFKHPLTPRQIARMKFHSEFTIRLWDDLWAGAVRHGLSHEPWARAIQIAIRRGERRLALNRLKAPFVPLRNRVRRLFRGTDQSRSTLAKTPAPPPQTPPPATPH